MSTSESPGRPLSSIMKQYYCSNGLSDCIPVALDVIPPSAYAQEEVLIYGLGDKPFRSGMYRLQGKEGDTSQLETRENIHGAPKGSISHASPPRV